MAVKRDRRPLAAPTTFRISGQVVDNRRRRPVAGVHVQAWDLDVRFHSLLGSADTDAEGRFKIAFNESYFGDYGGDQLPDLFFRVFRNEELLLSTESTPIRNFADGAPAVTLEVDATGAPKIATTKSTEVTLNELGESVAASIGTVQRELASFPNALGAFLVDEIELAVPITMRVDALGQVMATVVDAEAPKTTAVGNLRLRIRPVLGATQPPPVSSGQSLESLGTLSPAVIKQLADHHVYSIDDVLRIARSPTGRAQLATLAKGTDVPRMLDKAALLAIPTIPTRVRATLVRLNVNSATDLVKADPEVLSKSLASSLDTAITADHVRAWQTSVRPSVDIPLPDLKSAIPVEG